MQPSNEALRFERLRAQDGQPMLPPPNLRSLASGGGLDPNQRGQAEAMWQAALAETQSAPSFPAEERLFWTTFMLANHHAEQGRRDVAAPLLEQTQPRLQQPRFFQVVTGMLARTHAAQGNLDRAGQFLAQLDAQSDDLQIDTNYRFSTAYVAMLRGDAQTTLAALGSTIDEVPISDAYDRVCGLYRAHAYEALGNVEVAVQQLQQLAPTPEEMGQLESMVRMTPQIPLVAVSLPRAKVAVTRLQQETITTGSQLNVGRMVGSMFLVVPLVLAGSFLSETVVGPELQPFFIGGLVVVTTLFSFAVVFRTLFKGAARRKKLMVRGVDASAKLMVVEQTGTRVNDQPMLQLRMMVEVPGKSPYAVLHREVVPQIRLAQLQPGMQLPVKVDPQDPRNMAIAWG